MTGTSDADWHVQLDEQDSVPGRILSLAEGYDARPTISVADEGYDAPTK